MGMGMSEISSAMGTRVGSETFGKSGITLGYSSNDRAWDEKGGREEQPRAISRGVRNPFLMDNSSTDAITAVDSGSAGGRSRPVRNRLLDDTSSPPSYDEAAAESSGRRFGRAMLTGGLFSRDRDRGNGTRNGNGDRSEESWHEKSEYKNVMETKDGMDEDDHDEGKDNGAKKGWWQSKGKGLRGRFGLRSN